jgi:heme oxygenase
MSLKELTWENHKRIERASFARRLVKGKLSPHQFYKYLSNQLVIYHLLEQCARETGLLEGIEEICRSERMLRDLESMEKTYGFQPPLLYKTTNDYVDYIMTIHDDPEAILAHVYVRHMGDLSGGQIIKKFIPVPTTHYDFDCDIEDLKNRIRAKLSDSLADEANRCFTMIYAIFDEMEADFARMEKAEVVSN